MAEALGIIRASNLQTIRLLDLTTTRDSDRIIARDSDRIIEEVLDLTTTTIMHLAVALVVARRMFLVNSLPRADAGKARIAHFPMIPAVVAAAALEGATITTGIVTHSEDPGDNRYSKISPLLPFWVNVCAY